MEPIGRRRTTFMRIEKIAYELAVDFQNPVSKNENDIRNRQEWLATAIEADGEIDPIIAAELE